MTKYARKPQLYMKPSQRCTAMKKHHSITTMFHNRKRYLSFSISTFENLNKNYALIKMLYVNIDYLKVGKKHVKIIQNKT